MKINIDKTKNTGKEGKKRSFTFPKWKLPSLMPSKKIIGFLFIYVGATIFFSLIGWAVAYPPVAFLAAVYTTGVSVGIIFIAIIFIICGVAFIDNSAEECRQFLKY